MFSYAFRTITPAVKAIMIACAGVFSIQVAAQWFAWTGADRAMVAWLGLGVEGIQRGWWWQLVTYGFLHGGFLHLLLNMLGLFFLGPELERALGFRSFWALFLFCVVLGGVGWLLLTWPYAGFCVGASGGVFGIIGAFAALFPHRQLTLLVFFVLPVTMPAWLLAVLFGLIQLGYLLNPDGSNIAYAAHLAGGLAGYLFVKIYRTRRVASGSNMPITRARPPVGMARPSDQEINAILDKISRDGIHRLTPREREMLHRAGKVS